LTGILLKSHLVFKDKL